MKVTALEEYGLRCMLLFTKVAPNSSLTLPEISSSEGLSLPYAGKLLTILKKAGLVKAVRGRNGGYILSRTPHEISLKEIFSALGDSLYGSHHCKRYSDEDEDCMHSEDCRVRGLWYIFDEYIQGILGKVSLADIATGRINVRDLTNIKH